MYDEERWRRHLTGLGHPAARPLAAGMEGAVWSLGDGLVAKVWFDRGEDDLHRLGAFLDDVAHAGLSFGTPRFLSVGVGPDAAAWTLEPELDGRPLAPDGPDSSNSSNRSDGPDGPGGPDGPPELTTAIVEVLLEVHGELSQVVPSPGLRRLPVLGEDRPLLTGRAGFPEALAGLVDRRLLRTGALLRPGVPGLDELAGAVTGRLRGIEDAPEGLVHGDLFPANILVDDRRTPTAVLDFGFLSTIGDPAFDAAVTAGITDLYGPQARANREILDTALIDRFAYSAERLSLYRLAYALVTAAWYDPAGQDGHTRWCQDILSGPDAVRAFS